MKYVKFTTTEPEKGIKIDREALFGAIVVTLLVGVCWLLFMANRNFVALQDQGAISKVTEIYNIHEHYHDWVIREEDLAKMPWKEILK